jgi:hypothetical protein
MSSLKNKISEQVLETIRIQVQRPVEFFQVFKNAKGTRFTGAGFEVARTIWKTYTIKLPEKYIIVNRTLLMLDSRMTWPYYLSKRQLVLFNEMDAFEFSLYSGDINLWSIK